MSQHWRDWPIAAYSDAETYEEIAERFEYFEDDVLINTYYKSGTTLTQELVYSLLHGVDAANASNQWLRSPFLDWARPEVGVIPMKLVGSLARPRVLKTHLPAAFHLRHLNSDKGPRVLVVMRNPKDTMVSAFHHFSNSTMHANHLPKSFSEQWKMLALGCRSSDARYHNFFDFTLSWWAFRDHPRVRVYFYEDMVARKAETVRSIAQFLGVQATEQRVQEVVEHTSFDSMRENPQANPTLNKKEGVWLNSFNFIRKGQVGDWKNHFTVADSELMDRLIQEKLDPCRLKFAYTSEAHYRAL